MSIRNESLLSRERRQKARRMTVCLTACVQLHCHWQQHLKDRHLALPTPPSAPSLKIDKKRKSLVKVWNRKEEKSCEDVALKLVVKLSGTSDFKSNSCPFISPKDFQLSSSTKLCICICSFEQCIEGISSSVSNRSIRLSDKEGNIISSASERKC